MTDIDQQIVFNKLPLNQAQRKKLYDALNAERQIVLNPAYNSQAQCSLVKSDQCQDQSLSPLY